MKLSSIKEISLNDINQVSGGQHQPVPSREEIFAECQSYCKDPKSEDCTNVCNWSADEGKKLYNRLEHMCSELNSALSKNNNRNDL